MADGMLHASTLLEVDEAQDANGKQHVACVIAQAADGMLHAACCIASGIS